MGMIMSLDLDFWDRNQNTDVHSNVLVTLGVEGFYLAKGIAAYYLTLILSSFSDGNLFKVETGLNQCTGKIAVQMDINVL